MIKIRPQTFETNSSSSHALVIAKASSDYKTLLPDENGKIVIEDDVFGHGHESTDKLRRTYDPALKTTYLVTFILNHEESRVDEYTDRLKHVIMKHTGATLVEFVHNDGNIDHNSVDIQTDVLSDDNKLKEFIFGTNSYLRIASVGDDYDEDEGEDVK